MFYSKKRRCMWLFFKTNPIGVILKIVLGPPSLSMEWASVCRQQFRRLWNKTHASVIKCPSHGFGGWIKGSCTESMRFCEKNIHISSVILFSHQCQRHYNLYRCNRFPQLYHFWSLDFLFYFVVYFKVNLMPPMLKSSSHELIRKPLISCCYICRHCPLPQRKTQSV